MKVKLFRRESTESTPYWQEFEYEVKGHISILNMLEDINKNYICRSDGKIEDPVCFESSCQQGLCGSCAMIINNEPRLACQTFCDEFVGKADVITVSPLTKFPVIKDLMVDRSEMFDAMNQMKLWMEGDAKNGRGSNRKQYQAALCVMCGCCLEACPNYAPGDLFKGLPAALATVNILKKSENSEHKTAIRDSYIKSVFKGCTKSMACEKVCPMSIPGVTLLAEGNRLSVWKLWKLITK